MPHISADRVRIRQILNNLVTNSLEALEGGGARIEIETQVARWPKQMAAIVVTDNGPGFQRDLIGTVFDPYVTSKPKGTGLGLAIVKKSWKSTADALRRIIGARAAPACEFYCRWARCAWRPRREPRKGEHRRERV